MKVLTPFLLFPLLLLCGANLLFASNSTETTISKTSAFFSNQNHHQISTANHITTVLDFTDIDLEEDNFGREDHAENTHFQLSNTNVVLVQKWFAQFTEIVSMFNLFVEPSLFLSGSKNVTPFYISLRALRI